MNKKFYIILISLMIFIVYHGWAFYTVLSYQYLDINVKHEGEHYIVSQIGDFMPKGNLGIQEQDIILRVNGQEAGQFPSIRDWGFVVKAKQIEILRGGETILIDIDEQEYKQDVRAIISGLICYVLAFLIFQSNRQLRTSRILSIVFFASGLLFISILLSGRGDLLGKFLVVNLFNSLPVLFYLFLLVFFEDQAGIQPTKVEKLVLKWSYSLLLLCAMSLLFSFHPEIGPAMKRYFSLLTILFVLFCGVNFTYIIRLAIKHKNQHTYVNTLLKTVFFFFCISIVPFLFLYLFPHMSSYTQAIPGIYAGLLFLIFPASFAYLIRTKQVYDIPLVTRRLFFTAVIALVPTLVLLLSVIIVLKDVSFSGGLVLFFLFITLITTILYTLENLKTGLDKVMFPRKYYLQNALNTISKKLRNIQTFRELEDIILKDIVKTIDVNGAAIAFRTGDSLEIIRTGMIETGEVKNMILYRRFDDLEYSTFQIQENEEYQSYLVMTSKKSNTRIGQEDSQWIRLIITYLAVCLENLYLIRKLTSNLEELAASVSNENIEDFKWIRKMMFEIQEGERERIAVDLHDSTMQDLFYLKRKIVNMFQKYVLTQEDLDEINRLKEYIEVINTNLRDSCFELHPYLLSEIGLLKTIRALIDKESLEFEVECIVLDQKQIETIHFEYKKHIFRIFQELLSNSKKHSEASHVFFSMKVAGNELILNYQDDGIGFDVKKVGTKSIGLRQIKSRVLHMQGQIHILSRHSEGIKVEIQIPLKETAKS
jgi:two-component system sensor histidine kinase ComP